MPVPQFLLDLLQLLLDLAVPAAFCTLAAAGVSLRYEGGTNFHVGGRTGKPYRRSNEMHIRPRPSIAGLFQSAFRALFHFAASAQDFRAAKGGHTLPPRKKFSEEEQSKLAAQLEVPFDPNEIKWRVVKTGQRGRRGAILPFADPRAYTDRLNLLLTPAGWSRECVVSHVPSLCRRKDDKVIVSAKILSAVAVTIHRLGSHTGAGEEWADEENAATSADAQAFKRACSYFGLGRYLYRFHETWVNLDRMRRPISVPILPEWALPPGWFPTPPPGSGKKDVKGPIEHRLTSNIEYLRRPLGEGIYTEILERAGHSRTAKNIPNADRQKSVLQWMQAAERGIERAHVLAGNVGERQFVAIMDSLKVPSLESVPSLDTLRCLVDTLEAAAEQQVA